MTPVSILTQAPEIIIGCIFLLTGIAKVLEPWKFIQHISQLRLFKVQLITPVSLTFTAIEVALGVALIMNVAPFLIIPTSIVLLIGFSILTYWSTSTKRTEDCGCYNGWLQITPAQSILLNLVYTTGLIFTLIGFIYQENQVNTVSIWQLLLILGSLIISGILANGSLEYLTKNGRPYIDLSPVREQQPWQIQWLGENVTQLHQLMSDVKILVFLTPGCPVCQKWLEMLKVVHSQKHLPDVIVILDINDNDEKEKFGSDYALDFPTISIDESQYQKLGINVVPTAVILQSGVIQHKWAGGMPLAFIEQLVLPFYYKEGDSPSRSR